MTEPTKEQIKWFWEQCKIQRNIHNDNWADGYPCYDSLDDLFKYAVPKIIGDGNYSIIITQDLARGIAYVEPLKFGRQFDATDNRNLALALFWAIYKAFGGKEG